jgi:DNA-binding transcriptional regulator YiaG
MFHYKSCGLNNIWLANGYAVIKDEEYGECVAITDTLGLHKAISHDLVFNRPTLTGKEFRFLRKELNLSQKALSDLLGNEEQAVARWEKTGKVPKWADRLLRVCVLEYYGEGTGIQALIARIRDIDERRQEKQIYKDDNSGWKKAA